MTKYIRPSFDNRLKDYVGITTDEAFSRELERVLQDTYSRIVKAAESMPDYLFSIAREKILDNLVFSELGFDKHNSLDCLNEQADQHLQKEILSIKADVYSQIDKVCINRHDRVHGLRLAREAGAVTGVLKTQDHKLLMLQRKADVTKEELQNFWDTPKWVSYSFLDGLRDIAEMRGIDWKPRHFLDDTAELSLAVGMYVKEMVKEIRPCSEIDPAKSAIRKASITGLNYDNEPLIALNKDGKAFFVDYEKGAPLD